MVPIYVTLGWTGLVFGEQLSVGFFVSVCGMNSYWPLCLFQWKFKFRLNNSHSVSDVILVCSIGSAAASLTVDLWKLLHHQTVLRLRKENKHDYIWRINYAAYLHRSITLGLKVSGGIVPQHPITDGFILTDTFANNGAMLIIDTCGHQHVFRFIWDKHESSSKFFCVYHVRCERSIIMWTMQKRK